MEFKTEENRIYATDPAGTLMAEVTFCIRDGVAVIDHTYVDPSLRGTGMAGRLMEEAVRKIQADGNALSATCSYAVAWLQRHPEIKTVATDEPVVCRIRKH